MEASFRPRNFILCTVGLALATFMQVLDSTIANVALPAIAGNLGASAQQSTWVITTFAVSNAIALPLTGWLVRRMGEVRLFLAATILFTLTSMLCGLAQNMEMLIFFRALQGFSAGPIFPVTQSLMIAIFPAHKRSQAIVAISIVTIFAPIAGPILGGWVTDSYNWRWIFLINIPVGIFATLAVWQQMRKKPEQTQRTKIDYTGLILLAVGVGALQIVLDKGNDEDWFASNFIIATSIIAAISAAAFLIWELNEEEPIVNLHIFRNRNFTVGTIAYALAYGVFIGGGLLIPLWLQTQMHYTAVWAGFATVPQGLAVLLLATVIGKYAHRVNLRAMSSIAFFIVAVSFYIRTEFNLDVTFERVAVLQFIQGVGLAMYFMPVMTILLSDLKAEEISAGAGFAMFLRMLCSSFTISLSNYLWNYRATFHHSRLAEHVTITSPETTKAIESLGHGNMQLGLAEIDQMITRQAYQTSFNEVSLCFALVLVALVVTIWFAKPPFSKQSAVQPSGEH